MTNPAKNLKNFRSLSLSLVLLGLALAPAAAQAGPTKASPFGIGVAAPVNFAPAGVGLGLSGKYWMNSERAWDMTLFGGGGWIGLSADYLWHRYHIFDGEMARRGPMYYGLGANLTSWSAGPFNGVAAGIQGKLGWTYLFRKPFDAYVELVPAVNIIPGFAFGIGLQIGGRWYF